MQRRSSSSTFLIIFIACFLLGVFSVLIRREAGVAEEQVQTQSPRAVDRSATEPVPDSQHEVAMLIGVDSLLSPSPRLRSIWMIEYHLSGRSIHFLGIPVNYQPAGDSTPTLQDAFSFSRFDGVHASLLATLNLLAPHPADVVIVLDEVALETGIDNLGGVTLDGDSFTGSQIVRVLRLLEDDPSANLKMQADILSALVQDALMISSQVEITELIELVPDHAYTNVDPIQLSNLIATMLPVRDEDISLDLFLPVR